MAINSENLYRNDGNLPLLDLFPATPGRVLDLGCGAGDNAKILRKRGWVVIGVTVSSAEQKIASEYCHDVYLADLNEGIPDSVGEGYDLVLMSHVLEHLSCPEKLLRDARKVLALNGLLAVALPNVLFYPNRLKIMLGRFDYEPSGIMDETHLRFYTFSTGMKLLVSNGYILVKAEADGVFPLWKFRNILPQLFIRKLNGFAGRHWPNLFGCQSLFLAQIDR